MDILGPSSQSTAAAPVAARLCVFCREEIRPGASVCCHCGSNLVPLQSLADQQAVLEVRMAALECAVAIHHDGAPADSKAIEKPALVEHHAAPGPGVAILKWPHMADNIFIGLAALLAAHWIATMFPLGDRTAFRLVALAVALPFGFRFETNARAGATGQVVAAVAFASVGTLSIGLLDALLTAKGILPATARDIVSSFATISLSHYAGSTLAEFRRVRQGRLATIGGAGPATSSTGGTANPLAHFAPSQIKTTAETVKALYDATIPIAASAAALWAAVGHLFF